MPDPFPTAPTVRTPIGRLPHFASWENAALNYYREGGRSPENVLTAEALQALDLLPRRPFLGEVILHCRGGAEAARADDIEEARLLVLPGTTYLRPSPPSHGAAVAPSCFGVSDRCAQMPIFLEWACTSGRMRRAASCGAARRIRR